MIITAYYKRPTQGIDGVFTIQDNQGNKLIDRVKARSGQKGHAHTSWTRGKSPIPFGMHSMSLVPYNRGQVAGRTGIGQFYPIGNDGGHYRIVEGKRIRTAIGLHEENMWDGSAGCVVIVQHKDWQDVIKVLDKLYADGMDAIRFRVI